MEKDMMQLLERQPLRCIYDDTARRIAARVRKGNSLVPVLLGIEYGRMLGKREERARRAKLA